MIPQRDISRIANSLVTAGRRRVPDAVIERDYVLAWFLVGLAGHELRNTLAFKGGTALRRCWFNDYRFSEDLDFTLTRPMSLGEILAELDGVFAAVEMASGIRLAFDREDRHNHQNSYTLYLSYQGPLPSTNDVKVDITINEALAFPLQDRQILRTYTEFSDLPDGTSVRTYALEEIAVEKLIAPSDRARNEPRDLYDLWHLVTVGGLNLTELRGELEVKLAFRKRGITGIEQDVFAKEARLRRLWTARMAHQMTDLPEFDGVFRVVQRAIRNADLPKAWRVCAIRAGTDKSVRPTGWHAA